jgi:hypothetical protein
MQRWLKANPAAADLSTNPVATAKEKEAGAMYKEKTMNESQLGNQPSEQTYEALKTRLRLRMRRVQRALNERAGIELPAAEVDGH